MKNRYPMKFLYYFADNGSYMSKWQYEHIINELSHYNIRIEVFNPLSYSSYDEANEECIKHLASKKDYNLLTPEQRNTFNTCNELFAHALTPSTASADISQPLNQKGDLTNGTMDEPSCNEINRPSQAGTDQTGSTTDPGQDRTQSRPGHAQSDHQCQ